MDSDQITNKRLKQFADPRKPHSLRRGEVQELASRVLQAEANYAEAMDLVRRYTEVLLEADARVEEVERKYAELERDRNRWAGKAADVEDRVAELNALISASVIRALLDRADGAEEFSRKVESWRVRAETERDEAVARTKFLEARVEELNHELSHGGIFIRPPEGHVAVMLPTDFVKAWAECADRHRPHMTVLFDACRTALSKRPVYMASNTTGEGDNE